MKDIIKICDEIVKLPNATITVEQILNLVKGAKQLGHELTFHIGHNLIGEPYIQGYNIT